MVSGHATTRPGQPVPGVAPPVRRSPGRSARSGLRQRLELLLLLGPAFVLFVGFVLVPIAVAVYYSFFKWSGFGPLNHPIGLANYRRAFSDTVFLHAIQHNVTIALLSLFLQLPLSIALALLLNRQLRGRGFLRLVVFAPYVLSEAVTAVMWLILLQPGGFVDQVF